MYDLKTWARRVIFAVSKMLSDFRLNILLKKNKLVSYRYIPSFCNLLIAECTIVDKTKHSA